jgi:transcriptional regulator GlxA family with amidase domain
MDYSRFVSIRPSKTIEEVKKTDLIIIPGLVGDMEAQIKRNEQLIDWIRVQRVEHDAEIASLCRGAFLLAATGLMNGRACATHWLTHDKFQQMFPEVELLPEKVVSVERGIYTSGGAYSFLNLVIYLIDKYLGRETAIWCSKVAEVDFDRLNQNQFMIFSGQKDHSDEEILEVQEYIESNYESDLAIEKLAAMVPTSARNLTRRFKRATNNTPSQYIQRVRIEVAKKFLESTIKNVQEVMFSCGYQDEKNFRLLFKRYVGLTPIEYRSKFNREMMEF